MCPWFDSWRNHKPLLSRGGFCFYRLKKASFFLISPLLFILSFWHCLVFVHQKAITSFSPRKFYPRTESSTRNYAEKLFCVSTIVNSISSSQSWVKFGFSVGFVRGLFVFPSNQPRKSTLNYEQTTNKRKT